jgi:RND family efflux transporter MFP subunit
MPDDFGNAPGKADGHGNGTTSHAEHHELNHVKAGAHAHGPHHKPHKPRHLKLIGVAVLLAAISSAAYGIVSRHDSERSLANWTDRQAMPTVAVGHPITTGASRTLTLPGDVAAFYEAPIYARVNGYLHGWSEDIGAHVKAGQVLATIDTPDLDEQLAQARADLASARANAALADLTAKRWHALLASNSVSQQSSDEKEGNAVATRALVNAQQAHVDQLRALKSFALLTAPFDGVVTARNTDVGALINAGSSAAQPLFKVADVHEMRVYVRVPQVYASELARGIQASLTQPQYPGQTFPARLVTTSQSVAAGSRTVLVELMANNKAGKLWPGTYADVKFDLPADRGVLRVPASALIFRAPGPQLATLGANNRLVMKSVTIGRNLGAELEITGGLSASDRVVISPLDTLEDGEAVRVAAGPGAAAPPPDSGS